MYYPYYTTINMQAHCSPTFSMTYLIDIQHACVEPPPITDETLMHWAQLTLATQCASAELTLRFVDRDEIIHLNHMYRKQNKATNVLSFPSTLPKGVKLAYPLLGDVIICPSVLQQESLTLEKPLNAHWAHIVIHGVLHLLGYDHINDDDTIVMQALEIQLLAQLGFDNPYHESIEDNTIE